MFFIKNRYFDCCRPDINTECELHLIQFAITPSKFFLTLIYDILYLIKCISTR